MLYRTFPSRSGTLFYLPFWNFFRIFAAFSGTMISKIAPYPGTPRLEKRR